MKPLRLSAVCMGLILLSNIWADGGEKTNTSTAMREIHFADWDKILQEQRGHITVIDLWASWCAPCIERFPQMVGFYRKYQDQGVRFISLNFDEQGDVESLQWANQFLQRVGAVFPNYRLDENMSQAFERLDLLGLPVVLVFDAAGDEAYRLTNDNPNEQFDENDIENAVLSLMGR